MIWRLLQFFLFYPDLQKQILYGFGLWHLDRHNHRRKSFVFLGSFDVVSRGKSHFGKKHSRAFLGNRSFYMLALLLEWYGFNVRIICFQKPLHLIESLRKGGWDWDVITNVSYDINVLITFFNYEYVVSSFLLHGYRVPTVNPKTVNIGQNSLRYFSWSYRAFRLPRLHILKWQSCMSVRLEICLKSLQ